MADTIDLLQIKIEKAKRELSLETVNAIDAVDWRTAIIGLRSKYGYTFEQLGDLEMETELLLCGLVSPENYPKELSNRMRISKVATNELVNEMNNLVFKKIMEELIKNTERKKIFAKNSPSPLPGEGKGEVYPPRLSATQEEGNQSDAHILNSAGIEIIPDLPAMPSAQLMQAGKLELTTPLESREDLLGKIEKPEKAHPILAQKLSTSFKIPMVTTEHTLENITKTANEVETPTPQAPKSYAKNADPYRLAPDK